MKLFSIKRLIGLAAIYGAVNYARKHGGVKNAYNELLGKAKDLAGNVKSEVAELGSKVQQGVGSTSRSFKSDDHTSSSYGTGSYGGGSSGSGGFGGSGGIR